MNDKLLAVIRVGVTAAIGALLTKALEASGVLDTATIQSAKEALQWLVTIGVYVAIQLAASKWPIVNTFLSLFLSSKGPTYK